MDEQRVRQLLEISERYIHLCHENASDSMEIATKIYLNLIKLLLTLSVAALPVLATVLGLGDRYVPEPIIPVLFCSVLLFFISIVLGIMATGLAARFFKRLALKQSNELVKFLKIVDMQEVENYFIADRKEAIEGGMFELLKLRWFYGQLTTFMMALILFLMVFYSSVSQ